MTRCIFFGLVLVGVRASGQPKPPGVAAGPNYYYQAPGGETCASEDRISDQSDCEAAGQHFGYSFVKVVSQNDRPEGCFWNRVQDHGKEVFLNTFTGAEGTSWHGVGGMCRGRCVEDGVFASEWNADDGSSNCCNSWFWDNVRYTFSAHCGSCIPTNAHAPGNQPRVPPCCDSNIIATVEHGEHRCLARADSQIVKLGEMELSKDVHNQDLPSLASDFCVADGVFASEWNADDGSSNCCNSWFWDNVRYTFSAHCGSCIPTNAHAPGNQPRVPPCCDSNIIATVEHGEHRCLLGSIVV